MSIKYIKGNRDCIMLSKNKIKYIRSLELKKNRKNERVFIAEGSKLVKDLIPYFGCRLIIGTAKWLHLNPTVRAEEIIEVGQDELARASLLKTPQDVLAVFWQPQYETDTDAPARSLCLALDDVQDPGNVGTIARIADWFGIDHLFCSQGTADIYNPKTIQATMGALARVRFHYIDLPAFIDTLLEKNIPVYGTFLDGDDLYDIPLSETGLIVMGNEGKGISPEVASRIHRHLRIPNYPQGSLTSESLNVAVATAITCAEFRRRM